VLTFLAARDMLIPDPGRQAEPRQHAVQRLLASLPGQIGSEAGIWVQVVRGQVRVGHPALAYKTIRNYLDYLLPVLTGWASRHASLREVTRQDILDAVDARHGPVIQHRIVALRSLFRALRQEQVIFRDPTRGISLPAPARLPQPLPTDRVAGLLNRADGQAARLAIALVAIHAVPWADLVRIQTGDLDLASGTLTIRRGFQRRVIYLDEVTAALASQWLRYGTSAGPQPQPAPGGQPADRSRCQSGRPHHDLGHVRAARRPPGAAATGPHPGRGPAHCRPGPPGPRLRHHREHRHQLRPRRHPGRQSVIPR
jgi:integrase